MQRIYLLAAHEPVLDPRLDWTARFAPRQFSVSILGFADERRPKPAMENIDEIYKAYRFNRFSISVGDAAKLLAPEITRILLKSIPKLIQLLITAMAASIPLAAIAVFLKVSRSLLVSSSKRFASVESFKEWLRPLLTDRLNRNNGIWSVITRLRVVVSVAKYFLQINAVLVAESEKLPRPQLIQANDLETLLAGVIIKRRTGAKLIYDAHEFWPHSDVCAQWWEVKLWTWIESLLIKNVDFAVTVSPDLARAMAETYGQAFVAVPNCEPAVNLRTTPHTVAHRPIRFLFQGNFAPKRGIEELIQAWKNVDATKAILHLRGPHNVYRQQCISLADRIGVLDISVFFLDAVTEEQLINAGSSADVGIIPYRGDTVNYEFCCPNKLSQYMQAGLALMVNDLAYVRRTVEDAECGVVYNVNDEKSILQAIHLLSSYEDKLIRFRSNAKTAAENHFNWQNQSAPLYAAYDRLVSEQ